MKIIKLSFFLTIFSLILSACNPAGSTLIKAPLPTINPSNSIGSGTSPVPKLLPSIEIKGNFTPVIGGIKLADAKKIIIDDLKESGIKGNIENSIIIKEITSKEVWDNDEIQLFDVNLDYAWVSGVAIIKNEKIISFLSGLTVMERFVADLDNDKFYEVYISLSNGSGRILPEIKGYNPQTNKIYSYSGTFPGEGYQDVFYSLFINEGKLYVRAKDQIGALLLTKTNGKNELAIQRSGN